MVEHRELGDDSSSSGLTLPHIFSNSSNESVDATKNFIGLITFLFFLTIFAFILWKKCLFEKYGAYLPIDKNIDVQQLNKRKVFMSTKTYSVFKSMFLPLLNKLDMDYWSTHCGVDGYLYLLFQRRFYKLTQLMFLISSFAQLVLYFIEKDYKFSIFGTGNWDLDNSTTTSKAIQAVETGFYTHVELSTQKAWVSIFIIFMFTLLTIRIVQKTRRDAKVALESFYQDMSRYKDHECLKARTIHIKGVLPNDRTGDGVQNYLNKILKKKSYGSENPGKVTSILIVPDFTKQLEIEGKIQDLKDLKMLMSVQEPSCRDCFIPRKYRDPEIYQ
jgi:hypothetical protein